MEFFVEEKHQRLSEGQFRPDMKRVDGGWILYFPFNEILASLSRESRRYKKKNKDRERQRTSYEIQCLLVFRDYAYWLKSGKSKARHFTGKKDFWFTPKMYHLMNSLPNHSEENFMRYFLENFDYKTTKNMRVF